MPDVRVLIVAGDPLARAGLAALLATQPGCTVVGQMARGAEVLAALALYRPDVVLWDLGWEPLLGTLPSRRWAEDEPLGAVTALEHLTDVREAGQPVVVLLPDDTQASLVWTTGVRGLFLRDIDVAQLAMALQTVAQGFIVLDPQLLGALLPFRHPQLPAHTEALTPRELEVLHLLAEGLPNKTIADRLHISEHTVKFHVNALLGKLGAQSRTEAVVRAMRLGLLFL
jgi:two-component system, NarL family, nitrate/nitrite response regulator NarL